ncbi:hypothetical protein BCR34DRAFT_605166 [Clohesyomyces aquaticus]|uniref:DUF7791 domain-containing protein n=1 Tax=Clohesyomyces aquaticus TaxID=1231657 RepID=A0A1Y1Z0E1_9PLEO|nr:hypothetical protein BCR34DRAFT_605166 [Clohesyomyces aquaticus]
MAFGLACNVMQTINFSLEAASLCRKFYENISPTADIEKRRDGLEKAVQNLQSFNVSSLTSAAQDEEKQLQEVANDLVTTAKELGKELEKCSKKSSSSWLGALCNTVEYVARRKSKIEKLNASLVVSQGTRHNWLNGHTKLEQLVNKETEEIKTILREEAKRTIGIINKQSQVLQQAVASENATTRNHIDSTLKLAQSEQISETQKNTLMDSLYYPDMNARRNQSAINQNHESTFHWIFEDFVERGPSKWSSFTEWLRSEDKLSISDWSPSELVESFIQALGSDTKPVCLFIDGRDEVEPREFDGQHGLLKRIHEVGSLSHVKLCIGSREEPTKYSPRRFEDLSSPTIARLNEVRYGRALDENPDNPVNLVAQSIRTGTIAFDDWEQLQKRIEMLPREFAGLYREMWMRLNQEDWEIYRAESALYFTLALTDFYGSVYGPPGGQVSFFEMLLWSNELIRRALLAGGSAIPEEHIIEHGKTFQQQLNFRCAGLLETQFPIGDSFAEIHSPINKVSFIHRSVKDFLKGDLDGQKLLRYAKHTPEEISLLSEIDWSYKPEYDNFIKAMKEYFDAGQRDSPSF